MRRYEISSEVFWKRPQSRWRRFLAWLFERLE
jgi:hypothetical protein